MKVTIEKVPEGVRVSLTHASSTKRPITIVIGPGQIGMVEQLVRTAMAAQAFKVDIEL